MKGTAVKLTYNLFSCVKISTGISFGPHVINFLGLPRWPLLATVPSLVANDELDPTTATSVIPGSATATPPSFTTLTIWIAGITQA